MNLLLWSLGLLSLLLGAGFFFTRSVKAQVEAALPPQGRFVDVPGARLHVIEKGGGPPLLLIHGLSGNLCNYTYGIVDRLADRYRVIAVDRPGSGYSVRNEAAGADLATQADAIAALIDALKLAGPPVIVGHSLGGALALCLAQRHPSRVAALALLAPLTHPAGQVSPAFAALKIRPDALRRVFAWTLAVPLAMLNRTRILGLIFGPEPVPADFGVRGGGFLGVRPGNFVAACQDYAAVSREGALSGQVAAYAALRLPVRVLFGRGDLILNPAEHGAALAKALPGATLTLIDGGHMIPITAAQTCADFVASVAEDASTAARPAARMA